mmetsp:Transcript_25072/g.50110  ORF Transcript_25072/g.50110 Transcript_25072/m.50110 type:complete len:149 (-) Transcript_25072:421-867(-)
MTAVLNPSQHTPSQLPPTIATLPISSGGLGFLHPRAALPIPSFINTIKQSINYALNGIHQPSATFSLPASPASTTSGTSTQQTKHSPLSSGMSRIFASIFTYDSSTNPASLPSKTINKFISSQSTSFYRISSIVVSPALLPFTHYTLQ